MAGACVYVYLESGGARSIEGQSSFSDGIRFGLCLWPEPIAVVFGVCQT